MRATTDIILRGLCWILFLAGVTALITACTETQAPEQLVFADPNQPMAALVYIAEAQGYFKDENLSLSYKKFTSGRDALRSVLAGEADVGVATEFPFASNLQQGAPLRILATLMRTNHYDALVGRRDLGIASLADLAGKRIGVAPHTNSEFMLSRMLREVAIPEDRVTPEQMVEALARGEVDGIATWMPHIADAQARLPEDQTVTLRTPSYINQALLGTQATTLDGRREALQRLLRALVRAQDYLYAHPEEALHQLEAHLVFEQRERMRQDWNDLKFQVRLDNMLLTTLENEGAWLAARSSPQGQAPDYRAALATEILEAARPEAVTLEP